MMDTMELEFLGRGDEEPEENPRIRMQQQEPILETSTTSSTSVVGGAVVVVNSSNDKNNNDNENNDKAASLDLSSSSSSSLNNDGLVAPRTPPTTTTYGTPPTTPPTTNSRRPPPPPPARSQSYESYDEPEVVVVSSSRRMEEDDLIIGSDHDGTDFNESTASFFGEDDDDDYDYRPTVSTSTAVSTARNKSTIGPPPLLMNNEFSSDDDDEKVIPNNDNIDDKAQQQRQQQDGGDGAGGGGTTIEPASDNSSHSSSDESSAIHNNNNNHQNDAAAHAAAVDLSSSAWKKQWHDRIHLGRIKIGQFINHEKVQSFTLGVILLNSFMMGVNTLPVIEDDPVLDGAFGIVDKCFLVIFTVEVFLQFVYRGWHFFTDSWLTFDLCIVTLSWAFEKLQIVRAFRIFRAVRLFSRVRPLRNLVTALAEVASAAYAICFLLAIVVYVYAVLFTELFGDLPLSKNYFKTLDASLFTCIELLTMDNWGDIAREVMEHRTWAWAPISIYVGQTGLIITNIFVAIICDAVSVADTKLRNIDLGIQRRDSSGELTYTPKSPEEELYETQERVDAIQSHVDDMVASQKQVLMMLEQLGNDLSRLRIARLAASDRETQLRIELEQRKAFEESLANDSFTRSPGAFGSIDRPFISFVGGGGGGGGGSISGGSGGGIPVTPGGMGRGRKSLFYNSDGVLATPGKNARKSMKLAELERKREEEENSKPMLGLSVVVKPSRLGVRRGSHSPKPRHDSGGGGSHNSNGDNNSADGRSSRRGKRRTVGSASLSGLSISLHGLARSASAGKNGSDRVDRRTKNYERGTIARDDFPSRSSLGSVTSGDSGVRPSTAASVGGGTSGSGTTGSAGRGDRRRMDKDVSRSTQGSASVAGSEMTEETRK